MEEVISVVLIVVIMNILWGCTAPDKSTRILEEQGFTNVEITGYSLFSCGQDDTFSTGFRATNPAGRKIDGTVCCGVMKGCTVRF